MNLTRAQKVRLGTFIASGVVLFAGTVITLTSLEMWEQRDLYTVHFTDNVGGLEVSAPVKFQGLRVGRVEGMGIAADNPSAIEVTLSLDRGTVLSEGAKAVLDQSGLTGLKTINLTPGEAGAPIIEPGSRLPAGSSLLDRLSGQAELIAVKIEMAANNLVKWTDEENRQRVVELLESTNALAQEIDRFLEETRVPFGRALNGVAQASNAVTSIAAQGEHSIAAVQKDIGVTLAEARATLAAYREPIKDIDPKEVAQAVEMAGRAMASLDSRLSDKQLGKAIDELLATLTGLTALLENTDLTVRAGREDFIATLKYVRQAAEDLREFSRIIAQNPSALISGRE